MKRILASAILLASIAAAQEEEEPEFYEEERDAVELHTLWDFRFVRTSEPESWLAAGLGKGRYGGDGEHQRNLFRVAQASFVLDLHPASSLKAHVHANLDLEPEFPEGRFGGDRFRLIEAFADWRPAFGAAVELRAKGGVFFPPISLENVGLAWTSIYTLTPSFINAWVGEEMRLTGAELGVAYIGAENEVAVGGAGSWNNDPSGSLLAYRGWAQHDRQTGVRDRLPLPPLSSIEPGGLFTDQAPWVEPIVELDDRPGFYGHFSWQNYRFFEVSGLYFDSRGIPTKFDGDQYSWKTRFTHLGVVLFLPSDAEFLLQWMDGRTDMGIQESGAPKVSAGFRSGYVLLSVPFGRHRLSARYDAIRARDRDEFRQPADSSDEDGGSWTLAYWLRLGDRYRFTFEALRISSDRLARSSIGLDPSETELLLQLNFRVEF